MNVFRNIEDVPQNTNTVISVGTFDGVHLAHRQVIGKVLELSKGNNLSGGAARSFIVTFDPHPQEVLKTKTPDIKLLSSIEEKLKMFEELGINSVLIIKFTEEFSKTQAHDFYEKIICNKIGIRDLVIGYDHMFGHDREGNFEMLKKLAKEFNFGVHRVEEIDVEGKPVSSTRIRKAMAEGRIDEANRLLGYEYSFEGIVVEGDKVGRTIGFPTVNLKPVKENKVMPNDGIYCVKVKHNNEVYFGMMYVGYRPTLTEGKVRALEVNIFDFEKKVYGDKLTISFLVKLREDKKFDSKEELIEQIKKDKEDSLKYININIKS
jgi:riboflavin kinase/FMN adenylyltransferase